MELFFKLLLLCVTGAVLALVLREEKQFLSMLVTLSLAVAALMALGEPLSELLAFFQRLTELSGVQEEVFSPMLKVVGIAAVTKIGMSLCKETESDTAAALLEMGGTCCALLAALPLMSRVLALLTELI